MSGIDELGRFFFPNTLSQSPFVEIFLGILPLIPFLVALVVFALQAKTGFMLRGLGMDALYLPHKFLEAIAFIRSIQDGHLEQEKEHFSQTEL